jgi:PadR family transcriptional regulator, regulatory protein PadR
VARSSSACWRSYADSRSTPPSSAATREPQNPPPDPSTALGELGLLSSEGTLYPLLSRLRREELVDTSWVESDAGPPRRYYRLTSRGRKSLAAFQEQWRTFTAGVNRLLEEER